MVVTFEILSNRCPREKGGWLLAAAGAAAGIVVGVLATMSWYKLGDSKRRPATIETITIPSASKNQEDRISEARRGYGNAKDSIRRNNLSEALTLLLSVRHNLKGLLEQSQRLNAPHLSSAEEADINSAMQRLKMEINALAARMHDVRRPGRSEEIDAEESKHDA
mmetsp:Transcript_35401/g.65577  ORF Transcript_35401/g.65577 Transcript_35401/m.65577 type:complete len:165 (-) Transcript_35401:224-718(-)